MAGRKIFVGSLPLAITQEILRNEFGRFGQVEDIYIKPNCEPARQWAFVTFATAEQALMAKDASDRILVFPGAENACEVMLAKNQGMFGQGEAHTDASDPSGCGATSAPKKIFVGSLPDGISEDVLRNTYSQYGVIEDVYIKHNCEPGRQWSFISFQTPEQAQHAQQITNGVLMFPGTLKPCEVTMARNQGMFGKDPVGGPLALTPVHAVTPVAGYAVAPMPGHAGAALTKIFVGSLPESVTESVLRAEFSKYGQITDVFMKTGCDNGRNWAFLTFASPEQAATAKSSSDMVLMFPGSERPCEVTWARNQGMYGQGSLDGSVKAPYMPQAVAPMPVAVGYATVTQAHFGGYAAPVAMAPVAYAAPVAFAHVAPLASDGPRKIFVGSLPDNASDAMLRAEYSKYGQVVDVFMKQGCEPGRHWAFVTFAAAHQAHHAKESTDRVLVLPGGSKACEVMLAKNQGKFGKGSEETLGAPTFAAPVAAPMPMLGGFAQPPPPMAPPPAHLTAWRMYYTAGGIAYYHNHSTGVTQWEAPPELQAPAVAPAFLAGVRYAPY